MVFSTSLSAATTQPAGDLVSAATAGTKLPHDQAGRLEAALRSAPNDAEQHATLLGLYSLRPADDAGRRLPHVLWTIENRATDPIAGSGYCRIDPEIDPAGYAQGRRLWLQIEAKAPDDLDVLRNASAFMSAEDDVEAERMLAHAAELRPKEGEWPERLALVYERRALRQRKSHEDRQKSAWNALGQRQRAYLLTHEASHRFGIFVEMPRDAVRAGDYLQAKKLAQQALQMSTMVRDDPAYGAAVNVANIVLGRVALNTGDVDSANAYLQAAGQAPASPVLASIGPDMSLAKELLKRGQRKTVRDYLDACLRLWPGGATRVRAWIATVDAGETPDFGTQALE
ncbi:MAG TPA: hypothetical protein VLI90_04190 [Tepidisphaeraceae bacterium]|nr:hypothetical protein [Tepidisphaeraceae bacterium]